MRTAIGPLGDRVACALGCQSAGSPERQLLAENRADTNECNCRSGEGVPRRHFLEKQPVKEEAACYPLG